MILTLTVSVITVLLMVITVIFKPYIKIKKFSIGLYWIVCLSGALILLISGALPIDKAIEGITADSAVNPLKILALFLSMTLLSVFLGDAGFFNLIANKILTGNIKSQIKLFLALYLTVAVLTVFTSNDIIILTFTPPICIFCKKAKISPIPFLFGEFVSANTWSMMLVVGNPTNVYLATSGGITFLPYFLTMALPTLLGGITGLGVLLLLFRKPLFSPLYKSEETERVKIEKVPMIFALILLSACIILLAVSEYIGLEMWLICVCFAIALTVFNLIFGIIKERSAKRVLRVYSKAPYELIPFVLSMFIIVLSLERVGLTEKISSAIVSYTPFDGVSFGFISALSANLLNNIPMSVLFSKIATTKASLFGAIIGSNIGAFITPVGALAGIMWNKILNSFGFKFSFKNFFLFGVAVAIPTVAVTSLTLLIFI